MCKWTSIRIQLTICDIKDAFSFLYVLYAVSTFALHLPWYLFSISLYVLVKSFPLVHPCNYRDFRKNSPGVTIRNEPSSSYLSSMSSIIISHFGSLRSFEWRFWANPSFTLSHYSFKLLIESHVPDLRPRENSNFLLRESWEFVVHDLKQLPFIRHLHKLPYGAQFTWTLGEPNTSLMFIKPDSRLSLGDRCFFIQNGLHALLFNY
jgi:hypothetical protein